MRTTLLFSTAALAALLPACGSSGSSEPITQEETGDPPAETAFEPPAPKEGFTRIEAGTVEAIEPGADVTFCQYAMRGLDHDVDVLDVGGYQSRYGHHAIAFTYTDTGEQTIGELTPCMGTEVTSGAGDLGAFLGGPAGADDVGRKLLPEGVAFRVKKGQGIMLNLHYINTGDETIDGEAVVDIHMVDTDPNRQLASLSINIDMQFGIEAAATGTTSTECTAESDVPYIMLANHMHEYGASAITEVIRKDGTVEVMHEDPEWQYEMQFNLVFSRWSVEDPFVVHAGDKIRTTCTWANTTSGGLEFPREMCVGVGFALTTGGSPSAPSCLDGQWMPQLL